MQRQISIKTCVIFQFKWIKIESQNRFIKPNDLFSFVSHDDYDKLFSFNVLQS